MADVEEKQPVDPEQIAPIAYAIFEEIRRSKKVSPRVGDLNIIGTCMTVTGEARNVREAGRLLGLHQGTFSQYYYKKTGKRIKDLAQLEYINSAPSKAYQKIVQIAMNGKSESVAMRASERIRDEAGFKPTEKRQIQHSGTVSTGLPTLIMDISQLSEDERNKLYGIEPEPQIVDITPKDDE